MSSEVKRTKSHYKTHSFISGNSLSKTLTESFRINRKRESSVGNEKCLLLTPRGANTEVKIESRDILNQNNKIPKFFSNGTGKEKTQFRR